MTDFKEIMLANNRGVCLVDADDFDFINGFKWALSTRGYAQRCDGKKTIFMHRVINKTPDGMWTDHLDGDKLDNRKENLRTCSSSENAMNRKKRSDEMSSKHKGISWHKEDKIWKAYININKKQIYLGSFNNEADAISVYQGAAKTHYGEFYHE